MFIDTIKYNLWQEPRHSPESVVICPNWLELGYRPQKTCLVTVSLSMPWRPDDWEGDDPCWKLIAGVVELSEDIVDDRVLF